MTGSELRRELDSLNEGQSKELQLEALAAREKLMSAVKDLVVTAFNHDVATIDNINDDDVLYVQLHGELDDEANEEFGMNRTLSVRLVEEHDTNVDEYDEIFLHLGISCDVFNSYIESGGQAPYETLRQLRLMPIESINVHHITHSKNGTSSNIKHVTRFGSIDYMALSSGELEEHIAEFEYFLQNLPGELLVDEIIKGTPPVMYYSRPDINTDLAYINQIRQDLVNMRLMPQKNISSTALDS